MPHFRGRACPVQRPSAALPPEQNPPGSRQPEPRSLSASHLNFGKTLPASALSLPAAASVQPPSGPCDGNQVGPWFPRCQRSTWPSQLSHSSHFLSVSFSFPRFCCHFLLSYYFCPCVVYSFYCYCFNIVYECLLLLNVVLVFLVEFWETIELNAFFQSSIFNQKLCL